MNKSIDDIKDYSAKLFAENKSKDDEIARLNKRIVELEAEVESHAHSLSPAMVQAQNDQLNKENERLKSRVAELEARTVVLPPIVRERLRLGTPGMELYATDTQFIAFFRSIEACGNTPEEALANLEQKLPNED